MPEIIQTIGLTKTYAIDKANYHNVLNGIDLDIKKGEFVALMGPSGSGKSTLLYSLSGMDKVTSGSVYFDDMELSKFSEKRLAAIRLLRMGFVFQQINLLKNLSIFDNIILSAYLAKKESRIKVNQKATALMKQMGILQLADRSITQASGGQLQRVAVCRALINNPEIVFGDEPTGALNSKSAGEIMNILADINRKGTTILLATHDIKVAAKTQRVLYLLDGKIVAEYYPQQQKQCDEKSREMALANWLMEQGF